MRLLLDECLDHRLRLHFPGHDCVSAKYAGLAGLKNGWLLDAAEAAGFAVLITADQRFCISKICENAAFRFWSYAALPTGGRILSGWFLPP